MKKILLVDTNRAAMPIYDALIRGGNEVWVVGSQPSEPLAKRCPKFTTLDYSNRNALADFIQKNKFDFLVPGCTDVSYQACADVNGGRFPGIDQVAVTQSIHTKDQFRIVAKTLGISVPRVFAEDPKPDAEKLIVKPVDSFSGRGVTILPSADLLSFQRAVEQAKKTSPTGKCIIEEFVEGQLFSYSAFIRQKKVVADFIVQEECVSDPFAVDTSRLSWEFPGPMRSSLCSSVENLASHLGLADGLVHTQFIARDGKYWILEITRRCPGDLYSLLVELSTGYPYAASYAAPFIGLKAALAGQISSANLVIRHTACPKEETQFLGLQFHEAVHLRLLVPLVTTGEILPAGTRGRAALMFLACHSKKEQDDLYARLRSRSLYDFR
jgi:hypothetical protein